MEIAAIVLWIVALAFIVITVKNIISRAFKTRRCTDAVTGTVVDVKAKTSKRGGGGYTGTAITEYTPMVSYNVDGVEYKSRFTKAYNPDAYSPGQKIQIMYDPGNPSVINRKGASNKADLIMLFIGVVIAAIGAFLLTIQ